MNSTSSGVSNGDVDVETNLISRKSIKSHRHFSFYTPPRRAFTLSKGLVYETEFSSPVGDFTKVMGSDFRTA